MRMGNKGPHGRPWIWLMAVIAVCLAPAVHPIPARKLVKDPGPCRAPIAREAPGSSASLVEKRHLVLVDLISGFFLGLGGTLLTGTVCAFFHRGQRKVEMLGGLSP